MILLLMRAFDFSCEGDGHPRDTECEHNGKHGQGEAKARNTHNERWRFLWFEVSSAAGITEEVEVGRWMTIGNPLEIR